MKRLWVIVKLYYSRFMPAKKRMSYGEAKEKYLKMLNKLNELEDRQSELIDYIDTRLVDVERAVYGKQPQSEDKE